MSTALPPLPDAVHDEPELEALLSRPSAADVDVRADADRRRGRARRRRQDGPVARAARAPRLRRGRGEAPRARGGALLRARPRDRARRGTASRPIACDLLDPAQVARLPRVPERPLPRRPQVRLLGPARPHLGPERRRAVDRGAALRGRAGSWSSRAGTCTRSCRPAPRARPRRTRSGPVGEYAQTCVGRERVFEHASRERGTRCLLFRLFYAVDLRYGTLVDVARKVHAGEPVDLRVGHVNALWQGDASSYAFRSLSLCETPPRPLVVTGPEVVSVRAAAEAFARALRPGAPLRRRSRARPSRRPGLLRRRFSGPPEVPLARLVDWVAAWVRAGRAQPGQAHSLRGDRWPLLRASPGFARLLLEGQVIPAHPLALTAERRLDERRQVALTRYYCDAGAGGVAVGVHTTQFAIRSAGLLEPVLRLAAGVVEGARGRDRPAPAEGGGCRRTDDPGRRRGRPRPGPRLRRSRC